MTPEDWAAFQGAGRSTVSTRGRTLEQEGFVHCSFPDQVDGVIEGFFGDLPQVVVLTLDPERVGSEVRIEGGFPHLYGVLPLEAVVDVALRGR
jgi:uncharacterized protein (DUF952 family)